MTTQLKSKPIITTFLFDVGGVLLEKLSDIDEQICRLLDLDLESFRRAQETVITTSRELPQLWKELNTLTKEVEYLNTFYALVFAEMGANKTPTEVQIATMCQVKRGYQLNTGALATLRYLSSKYSLGILSNCFVSRRYFELIDYDLDKYFKAVVISREVDADKPEPEIFKRAFELLEVKPEQVALIDDKAKNLDAGRKLGIGELIHFRPKGDTAYEAINELADLQTRF
jgi:HAD superfamily hydrolase (TIGR01509 family)